MRTLHSPDMGPTFTEVLAVFHEKGFSPDSVPVTRYPNGTITADFRLSDHAKLVAWWSHTEQRFFLRFYDHKRSIGKVRPRGRFSHVSQVADARAYWTRVRKWMDRNIEWSEYRKAK